MGLMEGPEGVLLCKDLADGRHACLMPMTFGKVRFVVAADAEHLGYDDGW